MWLFLQLSNQELKNIKSYVLFFKKEKSIFWKISNKVYLKSYRNDEIWTERKNKDLLRAKKSNDLFQELNLTKEQENRIKWVSSISQSDINNILEIVYDCLASSQTWWSIKDIILWSKDDINYNPIFIVLLETWISIDQIIKMVEFPFKSEIVEILDSSDTPNIKYKKIEKITFFKDVQDWIKNVFIAQWAQLAWYLIAISAIIFWVKFKLFPLIEDKLVKWFKLDRDIILWDSLMFMWIFEKLVFCILWTTWFFLFLYIFAREKFYQFLYKFPLMKDILQYWNTLKLLMTYSFNYEFPTKFRKQTTEIVNQYFHIKENTELMKLWEITSYNYQEVKKKFWIKFFDPIVSVTLNTLKEWWSEIVESIISKKIDVYIRKMKEKQDKLSWIIQKITLVLIWCVVMIIAWSIMMISFNSLKAIQMPS